MIDPRSRSTGAFATLTMLAALAVGVAGCGGKSLAPSDGGQPLADGATDHPSASSCQCTADTQALTIDWACYCSVYGCDQSEAALGCAGGSGTWTRGCGFDAYTVDTPGGTEIWVFQTGQLVGIQAASDDSPYVCPNNHGLQRFLLRAGQFPPDSCSGVTTCSCASPDAGNDCLRGDSSTILL